MQGMLNGSGLESQRVVNQGRLILINYAGQENTSSWPLCLHLPRHPVPHDILGWIHTCLVWLEPNQKKIVV